MIQPTATEKLKVCFAEKIIKSESTHMSQQRPINQSQHFKDRDMDGNNGHTQAIEGLWHRSHQCMIFVFIFICKFNLICTRSNNNIM